MRLPDHVANRCAIGSGATPLGFVGRYGPGALDDIASNLTRGSQQCVDERWTVYGTVAHMSNANLCDHNSGLTSVGMRLGYKLK